MFPGRLMGLGVWGSSPRAPFSLRLNLSLDSLAVEEKNSHITLRTLTDTPLLFSHLVLSDSATPWTAAHQAPLSSTFSQSLLKFMSIELVMLFNHLILCYPPFLLPSIFPNLRVFSYESALCIRCHFISNLMLPLIWQQVPVCGPEIEDPCLTS